MTAPAHAHAMDLSRSNSLVDLAARINDEHRLARDAAQSAVQHAIAAGHALAAAKAAVPHGEWLPWLERNCEFSERTARNYMRLAETVPTLPEPDRQRVADLSIREAVRAVATTSTRLTMCASNSSEWYTPAAIVDLVTNTLGEIDLDPSWHSESPVKARRTFSEADNGLAHPWSGRVFLNPPYGRAIDGWIEKLVAEFDSGSVSEAIALVPARTDTTWFRKLDAFPRCFVAGRVTFANAEYPAPFPSALFYLGRNVAAFIRAFDPLGGVFVRVAP